MSKTTVMQIYTNIFYQYHGIKLTKYVCTCTSLLIYYITQTYLQAVEKIFYISY